MKQIITVIIAGMMVLGGMAQQSQGIRTERKSLPSRVIIPAIGTQTIHPDLNHWPGLNQFKPISGDNLFKSRVLMQQLDMYENQYYDVFAMAWVNDTKNEFTYDASGNNTSDILSIWSTDNEMYEFASKQEFEYTNGQMTQQLYFNYDENSMEWVQYLRWLYTYDTEGNLTISYTYFWNGSSWEMTSRNVRTYNGEGLLISDVNSFWDESSGSWINNSKEEYTYDLSGHLTVTNSFLWDMIMEDWRNTYQYENIFEGDFLTQSFSYTWDMINNVWVNEYMNEYTYDGNMNMVNNTESEWDGTSWMLTLEADYTYNNDYTIDELVMPWFFYEGYVPFMHMLTGVTEYENGSTSASSRSMLYYSEVDITGVPGNETSISTIYPQPATDQVYFSISGNSKPADLMVFDINGKLIMIQPVENENPVSVINLKPGLYFYRLTGDRGNIHTGKLNIQ